VFSGQNLWVATPLVKRQPLPEGIEWRGKRSDAAGMARVRILTS